MSNKPNEEVIAKIRKLMSLGKNESATDGEADNAMRFARNLLRKHGLSESDIDEPGPSDMMTVRIKTLKHWPSWYKSLVVYVGDLCSVHALVHTGLVGGKSAMSYSGTPTDIAAAIETLEFLEQSAKVRARERLGRGWSPDHHQFCIGFSTAVGYRIRQMIEEDKEKAEEAGSSDLMIIKGSIAKDWVHEQYAPKVQRAEGRDPGGSMESMREGIRKGLEADIKRERRLS